MAQGGKKKSSGGRKPASRKASVPRFTFEPGESSLPLTATVKAVKNEKGTPTIAVRGCQLSGAPAHLRILGQRITVTSPDKDVSFIVGPDVKKAHTYTVAAGGDSPVFSVVGGGDAVTLVYRGACMYKPT
jgi:hypothetical protein